MKYIYEIQCWKDGRPVKHDKAKTKSKANKLALRYREAADAIDICEVTEEEGYLHTKTTHTLWDGTWEVETHYIGEDD